MLKTQYKVLLEEIRGLTDRIDGLDRDLTKDRQDMGNFNVALTSIQAQLDELRKSINQNADRVKDKVHSEVQPIVKSTDRLSSQIEKSKMTVLKEKGGNWVERLHLKAVIPGLIVVIVAGAIVYFSIILVRR